MSDSRKPGCLGMTEARQQGLVPPGGGYAIS
jgi:hypothetical protein